MFDPILDYANRMDTGFDLILYELPLYGATVALWALVMLGYVLVGMVLEHRDHVGEP